MDSRFRGNDGWSAAGMTGLADRGLAAIRGGLRRRFFPIAAPMPAGGLP